MEIWRRAWREGFVPSLPKDALRALREALRTDNPKLIQGATVIPPSNFGCEPEAACAITFGLWRESDDVTTGMLELTFGVICREADERLGEHSACRHFLNWFDDAPRDVVRRELLAEVELAIGQPAVSCG